MKHLRIFIGSSKELEKERNFLSYLTVALEEHLERRGLSVALSKWEYVDPALSHVQTESRYLEEMLNSDLALILYWKFFGKWTALESDTAHQALSNTECRLNRRIVLYKEYFEHDEQISPELQEWKQNHPEEDSGTFSSLPALGVQFLHIIDSYEHHGEPLLRIQDNLIKCDDFTVAGIDDCPEELLLKIKNPSPERFHLPDVPMQSFPDKTMTVYLAADDEICEIRNMLADMSLELNEKWNKRNLKLNLRFYTPDKKEKLLQEADLALIIYRSKIGSFDSDMVHKAYEKFSGKFYVFFQDIEEIPTKDFLEFKNSFTEKLGQFTSSFRDVDTIRYKFAIHIMPSLLSYDKSSGDVRLGDYPIARLNKLTMVSNNVEFVNLQKRSMELSEQIRQKQKDYETDPGNKELFSELYQLRKKQSENEESVKNLMNDIFSLSRSIASLKDEYQNIKLFELERLLDSGNTEELKQLLADNQIQLSHTIDSYEQKKKELRESAIREVRFYAEMEMIRINAYLISEKSISFMQDVNTVFELYCSLCKELERDDDFLEILADIRRKFIVFCGNYSTLDEKFDKEKKVLIPLIKEHYTQLCKIAEKENDQNKLLTFSLALADSHLSTAKFMYTCHETKSLIKKELNVALEIFRRIVKDHPGSAEEQLADALLFSARIRCDSKRKYSFTKWYDLRGTVKPSDRNEVIELLQEALQLCGPSEKKMSAEISRYSAVVYIDSGDYEKAEKELLRALELREEIYQESVLRKKDAKENIFIYMGISYTPELIHLADTRVDLSNLYGMKGDFGERDYYWSLAMNEYSAILQVEPQEYDSLAYAYLTRGNYMLNQKLSGQQVNVYAIKEYLAWAEIMFDKLVEVNFEKYCGHLYSSKVFLGRAYISMFFEKRIKSYRDYAYHLTFEVYQLGRQMRSSCFRDDSIFTRLVNYISYLFLKIFCKNKLNNSQAGYQADRLLLASKFYSSILQYSNALYAVSQAEKLIVPLCQNGDNCFYYKTFLANILKQKYFIYRILEETENMNNILKQLTSLYRELSEKDDNYKRCLAEVLMESGFICGEMVHMDFYTVFFTIAESGRGFFSEVLDIYKEFSDDSGIAAMAENILEDLNSSNKKNTYYSVLK